MYQKGQGVAQSYIRAVELYRQGCEDGDSLGCFNLGVVYRDGLGVAQDYADVAVTDHCPDDPDKIVPGVCGCGIPDDDVDADGAIDCTVALCDCWCVR